MREILNIAKNTFREAIRDRILYGVAGFTLVYLAVSILLANISLGDIQMLKSFGLAGIYLFGCLITIFLGSSIIYKEIERRSLYFIISKPISRQDVIIGKFLGLFAAIALTILGMFVVYLVVVLCYGGGIDTAGLLVIFFQLLETMVLVALLVLFSTISTPLVTMIIGVLILVCGHALGYLMQTATKTGGFFYRFVQVLYYLLPNLEKFDLRNAVIFNIAVSGTSIVSAIMYAVFYTGFLLGVAIILLNKKEL